MKNLFLKNKDTLITLGIVTIAYAIIEILLKAGAVSSLFKGLLVPLCAYIILAISLNLTVGILGELSLGHAGFMCIGAFTSAFFSKITVGVINPGWLRFVIAILIGFIFAGIFGFLIGMPVLRLKGDYLAIDNPQSWSREAGHDMSVDELMSVVESDPFANVTFSGGDPMQQAEGFTELATAIKARTHKTIWCYTGYTFETLMRMPAQRRLLDHLDVLVDGPYVASQCNRDLPFRGSANQRIIDVPRSLRSGKAVLWERSY